jgi:hypothetical protein
MSCSCPLTCDRVPAVLKLPLERNEQGLGVLNEVPMPGIGDRDDNVPASTWGWWSCVWGRIRDGEGAV